MQHFWRHRILLSRLDLHVRDINIKRSYRSVVFAQELAQAAARRAVEEWKAENEARGLISMFCECFVVCDAWGAARREPFCILHGQLIGPDRRDSL